MLALQIARLGATWFLPVGHFWLTSFYLCGRDPFHCSLRGRGIQLHPLDSCLESPNKQMAIERQAHTIHSQDKRPIFILLSYRRVYTPSAILLKSLCVCACVCVLISPYQSVATATLFTSTSTESVQKSLEAKFFEGRQEQIPVTPTPEFQDRMGVSVQLSSAINIYIKASISLNSFLNFNSS